MLNKRYDKYKSIELFSIKKIPFNWRVLRLRYLADINLSGVDKKSLEGENDIYLCNYNDVFKNEFIDENINFMKATATDEEISRFALELDDVIATKDSESPYEIGIPAYVKQNFDNVVCGYHLAHIKSIKNFLDGKFLFRLLQSKSFNVQFIVRANGITRFGIGKIAFADSVVPLPSIFEQNQIATFLDYKTNQIDNLIDEKEKLLKLLEEKRIALITNAVTKGVDKNAKMKPTGINWLGEIPEHWGITALKRLSKISYGVGGEIDKTIVDGIRLLSLPNVNIDGELDLTEEYYTEVDDEFYLLKKGDLLFNWRNGSSSHLGKTVYFDLEGSYTNVSFLLRLRFGHSTNSRYYYYLLNSLRATDFFASSKAGVNNTFNLNELSNLPVFIPPLKEQDIIVKFLDDRLKEIIKLSKEVIQALEKLREYKTSVITSAVTGKIDVRNWSPKDNGKEDAFLEEVKEELE